MAPSARDAERTAATTAAESARSRRNRSTPGRRVRSSSVASASSTPSSSDDRSLAGIIYSHFDSHQRDERRVAAANNAASRAAAALRSDLLSAVVNEYDDDRHGAVSDDDDGDDAGEENISNDDKIVEAVTRCVDSAFYAIASSTAKKANNGAWIESVTSTFELAAAFVCSGSSSGIGAGNGKTKEGDAARAVLARAAEFSLVDKDVIRVEACRFIGMCAARLVEGGRPAASILKNKKGGGGNQQAATTTAMTTNSASWKAECLVLAARALLPRVTDKIAKVRHAAIEACLAILSGDNAASRLFLGGDDDDAAASREFDKVSASLRSRLLRIMSDDTSAANRASATRVLPLTKTNDDDDDSAIPRLIERIGDVDTRVREAALDSLREKVSDFETRLTEDQRAEILRMGLTKRCASTHAKTVELLCCNWLKSVKFDPLALLEKLNPVLNENVCEQTARVLLGVASTIDLETGGEKGVELVRKHFGGPEIRELRGTVLRKMNVVAAAAMIVQVDQGDEKHDDQDDNDKEDYEDRGDGGKKAPLSLKPSAALFLRVKCDVASKNKSDQMVSEIITDIPTLCNLLESHIDKLIEFNANDANFQNDDSDDDDMYNDEDAAAAFEDEQNFICLQLIHMAGSSELREEGSRRHFVSIMRRILARLATPDDLVEACVRAMASAHDKESQFLQTISEILVDVEDDDTFRPPAGSSRNGKPVDDKAMTIVRQMRIIAILSVVLESISGRMTSHPILDGFFQHLSPAITSKNAIVREHGVVCLSKFCLLADEAKVKGEFRPLLMTIAGSAGERAEVRAQAALALCDLALIHEGMLSEETDNNDEEAVGGGANRVPSTPFKDMLLQMLGHSKPGIVIVAAEIAAKLLLAGRLRDPKLVAWLFLIYFDATLAANYEENIGDVDGAEVKEVGNPVRLQQLLSVFFPTYSMSSLDANDDMMASVGPLLSIVNGKLAGMKRAGKEALARWPIAKMIEYICYTVDLADKRKDQEIATVGEKMSNDDAATIEGERPNTGDLNQGSAVEDANNDNGNEEADDNAIEASSTLLACIGVAEFLAEEGADSAPSFYIRALAKVLGSARIDIYAEDQEQLRRLKSGVNEAEYATEDGPAVRSIAKLAELLVDVGDDAKGSDEEESVASEGNAQNGEADEEEMEAADDQDEMEDGGVIEKENPRPSVESTKSVHSTRRNARGSGKRTLGRARLENVN